MRKYVVLIAAVVAVMGLPNATPARTNNCPNAIPPEGNPSLGITATGPTLAGATVAVCVEYRTTPTTDVEGGEVAAGVTTTDGVNPISGAPLGPGAYVFVDGDNDNGLLPSHSQGYIGLSNVENSGAAAEQDCRSAPPAGTFAALAVLFPTVGRDADGDDGAGSNSGGCGTIEGPGNVPEIGFPIPFLACGNTTGNDWDATSRDGCSFP